MEKSLPGYSGKPLSTKLGFKQGMNYRFFNTPNEYRNWMGLQTAKINANNQPPWEFVHLFINTVEEMEESLKQLRQQITPAGMIWVSWYKKSSGLASEINEDMIRDTALQLGLVDIKVCSVSAEWSALKLVIRKSLR